MGLSLRLTLTAVLPAITMIIPLGAQVAVPPPPPPPPPVTVQNRDVPPPVVQGRGDPGVRRVPVGTASVVGVVTAADTGRPVRGAQVMLSGSIVSAIGRGAAVGIS